MNNLPPGVTVNMIPGNRPGDEEWENFIGEVIDELVNSGLTAEQIKRRWRLGCEVMRAVKKEIKDD